MCCLWDWNWWTVSCSVRGNLSASEIKRKIKVSYSFPVLFCMLVSLSSNNLDASQMKLAKASEWEKFTCVCRFVTRQYSKKITTLTMVWDKVCIVWLKLIINWLLLAWFLPFTIPFNKSQIENFVAENEVSTGKYYRSLSWEWLHNWPHLWKQNYGQTLPNDLRNLSCNGLIASDFALRPFRRPCW